MTQSSKRIVIVGATSAIAEHCARIWVEQSVDLVLVGRNPEKLNRVADDLLTRNPRATITCETGDFSDPGQIGIWVDRIFTLTPPDIVLIAHGLLPDQTACEENLDLCQRVLEINGVSPVLIAEAFVHRLLTTPGHGTVAIIGSIAGDRGRKSNYVYGSAKGMVTRYAEGLQHRLARTGVRVVLIKPGPTDTPMTANIEQGKHRFADPHEVARAIIQGIEKQKAVVIFPRIWIAIMMFIRHFPRFFFNRLDI